MAFGDIVQQATDTHSAGGGGTAVLASAPTAGNLLVAYLVIRADFTNTWTASPGGDLPTGFQAVDTRANATGGNGGAMFMAWKQATGSEGTSFHFSTGNGTDRVRVTLVEIDMSGASIDVYAVTTDGGYSSSHTTSSITPTAANVVLVACALQATGSSSAIDTPVTNWTLIETGRTDGSFGPQSIFLTRAITGTSGSYSVSLTNSGVSGQWGSFIAAFAGSTAPTADFVGTPNPASIGGTVTFTDLSSGSPTSWSWDFGDGGTSTSQNPTHVYTTAGSYTVSLTATNAGGSDTETKTFYIVVADDPAPGFWIDWVGDGFDSGGGTAVDPRLARILPQDVPLGTAAADNITAYVKRADWYRGGSYDHVGANGPGGFSIILDNSDGRFDPENTASPYYSYLKPGKAVWAGAIKTTGALSGSGSVAGFLAGYIREFVPTVNARGDREVEVIGEDAFGKYQTSTVSVEPSLSRSYETFRGLILDGLGESSARRDLDTENGMLPFSAVDTQNGLDVLEELNRATATRHYMQPADTKEDWYYYTTVNKLHKLQAAADASLTGDDITDVSGWRVTNDNLIEFQRATVVPIGLTANNTEVWRLEDVPITVTSAARYIVWANFDDYVFDAELDTNVSSGSITTVLTNFGRSAKVELWSTSSATVGLVRILGRQVTRGDSVSVVAGDESSGARAGSVISSDYIGQTGAAQGLVDFIVWKYGNTLKRPSITVKAKNAATFSMVFERDLYDVLTLSIDKLSVTNRRVEIVGLRGYVVPGREWGVTYELQETPNQSALDWFDVNTDLVNGSLLIAPF